MKVRLRTLLIVLTFGPPILTGAWWAWQQYVTQRRMADEALKLAEQRHSEAQSNYQQALKQIRAFEQQIGSVNALPQPTIASEE